MENNKTKLTPDVLCDIGFIGEGKGFSGKPTYRLEWAKNHYLIQVELGDYPDDNPNSGMVSIYYPEMKDQHCFTQEMKKVPGVTYDKMKYKLTKLDHVQTEDDIHLYGIRYISTPEQAIPIAWHVTTLERLNAIYTALTMKAPFELRKLHKYAI